MSSEHDTNEPVTFAQRMAVGLGCAVGSGFLVGSWVGADSLVKNPTITGFADGALTLVFFGLLLAAFSLPVGLALGLFCQLLSFLAGQP